MLKKYLIFAFIAAGLNFLVMSATKNVLDYFFLMKGIPLTLVWQKMIDLSAKLTGIGSGFFLKYFLDKKYVFDYQAETRKEAAKTVSLYALMSSFTTLFLFAFSELYEWCFRNEYALYVGWALGLAIGYTIKFFLDKKFVFKSN
ncbi:MAG: GtrA family protein [Bacteroidia bacterium]